MLPYLLSERAPHWSPLPRGAYIGLTRAHRREHLVRAALEGVCQQLALVLASMRDAGSEVREIRATGGFARSALWRRILAGTLGMPIGFPRGHEGSAFGAALVGMEALGLVESIGVAADLVRIEDVVEPDERRGGDVRAGPADVRRPVRRARAGVPRAADARRARGAGRLRTARRRAERRLRACRRARRSAWR